MRVIEKEDGFIKHCTCLICLKQFQSKTHVYFCDNCFRLNSDIQLRAITESGRSFEDHVINCVNEARKIYGDIHISKIQMTKNEMNELYNLYKDRLKTPLPENKINTIMGIPIEILE